MPSPPRLVCSPQSSHNNAQEHIIYQLCIRCGCDTLGHPFLLHHRGPSYSCPECEQESFIVACSVCGFQSSENCPLMQLLMRKSQARDVEEHVLELHVCSRCRGDHFVKRLGGDEGSIEKQERVDGGSTLDPQVCVRCCGDHFVKEGRCFAGDMSGTANGDSKKALKDATSTLEIRSSLAGSRIEVLAGLKSVMKDFSEMMSRIENNIQMCSEIELGTSESSTTMERSRVTDKDEESNQSTQVICPQCCQVQCQICIPGYVNLVVDMKEFSVTEASEMQLCTMCEHWLCPGNSLVVVHRCRECGHEGCVDCMKGEGSDEEKWCVCCHCALTRKPKIEVDDTERGERLFRPKKLKLE